MDLDPILAFASCVFVCDVDVDVRVCSCVCSCSGHWF